VFLLLKQIWYYVQDVLVSTTNDSGKGSRVCQIVTSNDNDLVVRGWPTNFAEVCRRSQGFHVMKQSRIFKDHLLVAAGCPSRSSTCKLLAYVCKHAKMKLNLTQVHGFPHVVLLPRSAA
jgi:hypothetical protein